MRKGFLFLGFIIFALNSSLTFAQEVSIRSGEHPTFSRLVLTPPRTVEWQLSIDDRVASLRFLGSGWSVDYSEVYDRIPRTRLSKITWNQDTMTLKLQLECDCSVDVFAAQGTSIAIDIGDPSKEPKPLVKDLEVVGLPRKFDELRLPLADDIGSTTEKGSSRSEQARTEDQESSPRNIADFEKNLLRKFSDAASDGLLVQSEQRKGSSKAKIDLETLPGNTELRTPFSEIQTEPADLASEEKCTLNDLVNLASWAGERTPLDLLTLARQNLSPQIGFPSTEEKIAAIKNFLAAGFGLEAMSIIAEADLSIEEEEMFSDLAILVDNPSANLPFSPLKRFLECSGPGLIWAILADKNAAREMDREPSEIAASFTSLPDHIKRSIGPELIRTLAKNGDAQSASLLRSLIPDAGNVPVPGLSLADMEIATLKSDQADVSGLVDAASSSIDPRSHRAIEIKLKQLLDDGRVPMPRDVDLAASFAFELQGTSEGYDLNLILSWAHAALGDFELSFKMLKELEVADDPDFLLKLNETRRTVFLLALERTDDSEFVSIYAKHRNGVDLSLEEDAVLVSRRLIDISAPVLALAELAPFIGSMENPTKLIYAKALALSGQYRAGIEILAGIRDREAQLLRAELLTRLGGFSEASSILSELGQQQRADRLLPLDESLEETSLDTALVLDGAPFEESVQGLNIPALEQEPSLKSADILLESTTARMQAFDRLLK